MRNMFKITIFAAFAAVAGMSSILSGFGSAAMATPSLCDSIAGNLVANCGFETGDFTGWTPGGTRELQVTDFAAHTGNFGVVSPSVGADATLNQVLATVPRHLRG